MSGISKSVLIGVNVAATVVVMLLASGVFIFFWIKERKRQASAAQSANNAGIQAAKETLYDKRIFKVYGSKPTALLADEIVVRYGAGL